MLFLRILLGIAILAAIAATTLVWVQVKPQVETVIKDRNTFKDQANSERTQKVKVQKELSETKTKLEGTEKNLAETTAAKNASDAKATEFENQSKALTTQLTQTKEDLKDKDQKLAAWTATGLSVEQVKGTVSELRSLKDTNAALEDEKKVLTKDNTRLTTELSKYRGTNDAEVVLKPGTKGRILVVDPKWDFVVLDIGSNQELLPNGVLIVTREGKLVGKVKVSSVQQDRAIANIVPGSKIQEIMEGDLVFY